MSIGNLKTYKRFYLQIIKYGNLHFEKINEKFFWELCGRGSLGGLNNVFL